MSTEIERGEFLVLTPRADTGGFDDDRLLETAPAASGDRVVEDRRLPFFLSLVLPAHNEEDNIQAVTWEALAILPLVFRQCEVVIVDDGSTDATPRLVDRLAAEDMRVRVVHHPQNRGYGAALRSGFAAARGDRIMFMDSDRQFDIREVANLARYTDRHDIVAGFRIRRHDPWQRVVLGATFNTVVKILFGVWVKDIDCGFKIFRADLLRGMDLRAPGALLNTEILALAHRQGASLIEVGVTHHPRTAGTQSGGSLRVVFRSLQEMVHLWRRLRTVDARALRRDPQTAGAKAGE